MTEFSIFELVALIAAFCVLLLAIRPYVDARVAYAIAAVLCFYWVVQILEEGPNVSRVVLLTISVIVAFEAWWRHLRVRGRQRDT